jgi:hypothetical protein
MFRHPFRSRSRFRAAALLFVIAAAAWLLPAFAHQRSSTAAANKSDVFRFQLAPNPKTLSCFARYPNDPRRAPSAEATVVKGKLNDTMVLQLHNFKPHLAFDLFTVERSLLDANGNKDPNFHGFGLAWYQSDVEVNDEGDGHVEIKTILVNQIFGFDPDVKLAPTNTFHVGFWFNNPADSAACDPSVTPFNGEHHAGPLAMISVPSAATRLGPLCIDPVTSTNPPSCNP